MSRFKIFLPIFLTVGLLTLAFAPVDQFYLAWIGLGPWLWLVRRAKTPWRAFLVSWITGTLFFTANMWWMSAITWAGMIVLMIYLAVYWGLAGLIIRGANLLDPENIVIVPAKHRTTWGALAGVVSVALVWTASEWLRGNVMTGLPWLYLGDSQTPFLSMCQIADITGVYGVTAWIALLNAALLLTLFKQPGLPATWATIATLTIATFAYGLWRIAQDATYPGPTVLVVQPNFPQDNQNGAKSGTDEEHVAFAFNQTLDALKRLPPDAVNLVVWSETMLPPLNRQATSQFADWIREDVANGDKPNSFLSLTLDTRDRLEALAAQYHLGMLVGADYWIYKLEDKPDGKKWWVRDEKRNSAYFVQPDGTLSDQRYDKIHLVPFGEFIPFKDSIPWIGQIIIHLGPNRYSEYHLHDGSDTGLTVFTLNIAGKGTWRFVSPICFEDIDPALCATMFRPDADGQKRADFIVNITNDGWFGGGEHAQHMQAAIFRSIENRVPTARSVNTGTSGFIDSVGRTSNELSPGKEGSAVMQLRLDRRLTIYTRVGDLFAWLSMAVTVAVSATAIVAARLSRKR